MNDLEELLCSKDRFVMLNIKGLSQDKLFALMLELEQELKLKLEVGIIITNKNISIYSRKPNEFIKDNFKKYLEWLGFLDE